MIHYTKGEDGTIGHRSNEGRGGVGRKGKEKKEIVTYTALGTDAQDEGEYNCNLNS